MKIGIITEPSVWLYANNLTDVVDELFMGWAVGILEEIPYGESTLACNKKEETPRRESMMTCSKKMDNCGWYRVVTHYGYEGYLRKEISSSSSYGMSDMSFEPRGRGRKPFCRCTQEDLYRRDSCRQTAFISRPFADVMDAPTVHSQILVSLSKGSFVTVLSEVRNGYLKIGLANGQSGWIPRIFCEWRRENDGFLYDPEPETYFLRQKRSGHSFLLCGRDRKTLISYAMSYLGTGYRWAGKSASGIDCSGLTFMSYLMSGILIYRDAEIKAGYPVSEIPIELTEPGDLLYFPGHIAMYLGNQKYIHATGNEASFGCVINSLSEKDADYREDLAKSLFMAGSIHCEPAEWPCKVE